MFWKSIDFKTWRHNVDIAISKFVGLLLFYYGASWSGLDQAKKSKWFKRTNHRGCLDDYLTNARASSQHPFQVSWAVSACARPSLKGYY